MNGAADVPESLVDLHHERFRTRGQVLAADESGSPRMRTEVACECVDPPCIDTVHLGSRMAIDSGEHTLQHGHDLGLPDAKAMIGGRPSRRDRRFDRITAVHAAPRRFRHTALGKPTRVTQVKWTSSKEVRVHGDDRVRLPKVVLRDEEIVRRGERCVEMDARSRVQVEYPIQQFCFEQRRCRFEQQEQAGAAGACRSTTG